MFKINGKYLIFNKLCRARCARSSWNIFLSKFVFGYRKSSVIFFFDLFNLCFFLKRGLGFLELISVEGLPILLNYPYLRTRHVSYFRFKNIYFFRKWIKGLLTSFYFLRYLKISSLPGCLISLSLRKVNEIFLSEAFILNIPIISLFEFSSTNINFVTYPIPSKPTRRNLKFFLGLFMHTYIVGVKLSFANFFENLRGATFQLRKKVYSKKFYNNGWQFSNFRYNPSSHFFKRKFKNWEKDFKSVNLKKLVLNRNKLSYRRFFFCFSVLHFLFLNLKLKLCFRKASKFFNKKRLKGINFSFFQKYNNNYIFYFKKKFRGFLTYDFKRKFLKVSFKTKFYFMVNNFINLKSINCVKLGLYIYMLIFYYFFFLVSKSLFKFNKIKVILRRCINTSFNFIFKLNSTFYKTCFIKKFFFQFYKKISYYFYNFYIKQFYLIGVGLNRKFKNFKEVTKVRYLLFLKNFKKLRTIFSSTYILLLLLFLKNIRVVFFAFLVFNIFGVICFNKLKYFFTFFRRSWIFLFNKVNLFYLKIYKKRLILKKNLCIKFLHLSLRRTFLINLFIKNGLISFQCFNKKNLMKNPFFFVFLGKI